MVQDLGRVVSNSEVKRGYFLMDIRSPSIARQAKPGQFLTIRCGDATSPLLRRPFGFHTISDSGFQVLYEAVGKGTRLLSELKPGNKVDVLGPLGNGFTVPGKTKDVVIVAGGIGVAPLDNALHVAKGLQQRRPLDRKLHVSSEVRKVAGESSGPRRFACHGTSDISGNSGSRKGARGRARGNRRQSRVP